jgi:hypothetical protein
MSAVDRGELRGRELVHPPSSAEKQLLIALQTSTARDHLTLQLKGTGETTEGGGVRFAAQRRYYRRRALPELADHHMTCHMVRAQDRVPSTCMAPRAFVQTRTARGIT